MIDSSKKNNIFIIVIFFAITVSVLMSYFRYIVQNDFNFFSTEEEIPNQFVLSSYID